MIGFQHIPGYIGNVADDLLRDDRKQSQYPDVILPLRRDVLKKTTPKARPGAWQEAEQSDKTPIALMSSEQMVNLLIEYDIGLVRTSYDLIDLEEGEK